MRRREVQVREPGRTIGRASATATHVSAGVISPAAGRRAVSVSVLATDQCSAGGKQGSEKDESIRSVPVFPMASQFGPAVGYRRPVRGRLIGWENPDEEDHKSDNDQRARDQRCTRSDPVPPMLREKKCPISQYGGADRHCEPSPSSIDLLDSVISFPAQVDLTLQLEEMSAAWNKNQGGQAKSDKLQEHLSVLVRARSLRAATLPGGTHEDPGGHITGWSKLTRFRSVSKKETYFPTPGISIGSPRTSPPASPTFLIEALMSATPMTRAGTWAGQSERFCQNPPLMAPRGASGLTSVSAVLTKT